VGKHQSFEGPPVALCGHAIILLCKNLYRRCPRFIPGEILGNFEGGFPVYSPDKKLSPPPHNTELAMIQRTFMSRFLVWSLWSAFLAGCAATQTAKESPAPMSMADMPMAIAPTPVAPAAPPNTVYIDNFTYSPAALTVTAGTTVTFTNRDDIPHTVTSTTKPRLLDSPTLDTDQSYTFTFKEKGTYSYFCSLHPHMTAKVIVN
jgi:plastocyanin